MLSSLGGHEKDSLALIGHIHRVEPQQFAGRLHLKPHRQTGLVDGHPHARRLRNLIQRRSQPATRGVAHCMYCGSSRIQHLGNHAVQRRAIAADLALELQPLTDAHNGHAVVADGA